MITSLASIDSSNFEGVLTRRLARAIVRGVLQLEHLGYEGKKVRVVLGWGVGFGITSEQNQSKREGEGEGKGKGKGEGVVFISLHRGLLIEAVNAQHTTEVNPVLLIALRAGAARNERVLIKDVLREKDRAKLELIVDVASQRTTEGASVCMVLKW